MQFRYTKRLEINLHLLIRLLQRIREIFQKREKTISMNTKLFILVPILNLIFSSNAFSFFFSENKCEKLEWVAEDSRTQGGGWIWFPGKGTGVTVEESYSYAENLALQRLV